MRVRIAQLPTGELFLPISAELLAQLGWEPEDEVTVKYLPAGALAPPSIIVDRVKHKS